MQWAIRNRTLSLVTTLVLAAIPALAIAWARHGWRGGVTAAVAWGTCLFAGLMSLLLVQLFSEPSQVVPQVLFGMFPRMGIPLFACMFAYLLGGMLAETGFVYYIMFFYFVTLAIETVLMANGGPQQSAESETG